MTDEPAGLAFGRAVDADAPAGARGFYARCGFLEVGRRAYRGVPLIYYERLLDYRIEGGSSPCSLVISPSH